MTKMVHKWSVLHDNIPHICDEKPQYFHVVMDCCSLDWENVTCEKCLNIKVLNDSSDKKYVGGDYE